MTSEPNPRTHTFTVKAIGHVRTAYRSADTTPIQSQRDVDGTGGVVLDAPFRSGLAGLGEFDYVHLVTHLHRPTPPRPDPGSWQVVPFLLAGSGRRLGVFATRHPSRPNPVGLSLVRVTSVGPDGFEFVGVDLLDGTPVIDIKPWVAAFDTPQQPPGSVRQGWYTPDVLGRRGTSPGELT